MHWGSPIYLNLLIIAPLLAVFLIFNLIKRIKLLENFASKEILKKISASKSITKDRIKLILIIAATVFLILSMARPQMGSRLAMTKRQGIDILIAIDTSLSMKAQDIKPNRLEKAKLEVASFIDKLKGDRVGIVTFAGESFVQCPLTVDYNAAKLFLKIIDAGMIPRPGTDIASAINKAATSFTKGDRKYKVLILLTDGESHGADPIEAAESAKKTGVIIYTIGIGTRDGEPVPVEGVSGQASSYKKDRSGAVVISKLDEAALQRIAIITGGKYYNATPSEFELDNIYSDISKMEKKELSSRLFAQYEDRFQYFLALALILLIIETWLGDRRNINKLG